ncbi:MAG TPA: hypothetical protein VK106_03645 [Balneolaceae bacterium]|nr:hypothetical protein [Balneolaceae bacterium]
MLKVKIDVKRAIMGGALASILILGGGLWVGYASGYEFFQLFKTIMPTARTFCSTLIMTLATVLALMLALLGFSADLDIDLKSKHYDRINQVSALISVTLILSTLAYLMLSIPIVESGEQILGWFGTLYYITLVIASLLGGAFIIIILLLFNIIHNLVNIFRPVSSRYLVQEDNEEEQSV